jgi:hypothetical protein
MIDSKSQEIKAADGETYSNMLDLADELPDSSPRFILLSYPLTLVSNLMCVRFCSDRNRPPAAYPSHMCCCITYPTIALQVLG